MSRRRKICWVSPARCAGGESQYYNKTKIEGGVILILLSSPVQGNITLSRHKKHENNFGNISNQSIHPEEWRIILILLVIDDLKHITAGSMCENRPYYLTNKKSIHWAINLKFNGGFPVKRVKCYLMRSRGIPIKETPSQYGELIWESFPSFKRKILPPKVFISKDLRDFTGI